MISSLFTQEVRSTRNTLGTAAGWMLIVVVGSLGMALLRVPIFSEFALRIAFIASAVFSPFLVALLAIRYWKSMYGAEGYFTMVIPVRGRALYTVKVLYASIVAVLGMIVAAVALLLATVVEGLMTGVSASDSLAKVWDGLALVPQHVLWLGVVGLIFICIASIIQGASLMTIGASGRFNHLGIGAPIIGAVVLYFVTQIASIIALAVVPFGIRLSGPDAGSFVAEGMGNFFVTLIKNPSSSAEPSVLGLGMFLSFAVISVILAIWGVRSLERRTSLR